MIAIRLPDFYKNKGIIKPKILILEIALTLTNLKNTMKKFATIVFFLLSISIHAQDLKSFFDKTEQFLKETVSDGKVDYSKIKKAPKLLNDILSIASKIDIEKENINTQKAFWINTYNLVLIKAIIGKYPVNSPMDIAGLFDIVTFTLDKKKYSLNDIENKVIRPKFKDARVHFVLVCGANGCPPILNQAYSPEKIEDQLNKQTRIALNNSNFIKVNNKTKKVELSQIFEWYREDFITKKTKEIDMINQYREVKIDSSFKILYYPYDWTLNKK